MSNNINKPNQIKIAKNIESKVNCRNGNYCTFYPQCTFKHEVECKDPLNCSLPSCPLMHRFYLRDIV